MPTLKQLQKMSPIRRLAYWATEREKVRSLKERASEKPWTTDPILQSYRFCNVRRMDDKVSRWLMENWYTPFFNHPNMLAAVALARFINKPESLTLLTGHIFKKKSPDWSTIKHRLIVRRTKGETVFNGAYMVRGNSLNTKDKVVIVVDEYVRPMFEDVHQCDDGWILNTSSMQKCHQTLQGYYGYGSFMAGQVVADLRWAVKGTWKDKLTWAPMGPGSARGLARLVTKRGRDWELSAKNFVKDPVLWGIVFRRQVLDVLPPLLPRELSSKLEAHDYQSCLCEFDKFERVLWNEGSPKQRYPGG